MKPSIKRFCSIFICIFLIHAQTHAQSSGYTSYLGLKDYSPARGTEYTSGNTPGSVMMRINLWGAVDRPGIHNVPIKTDLITLLSYAGGPSVDAEMDEVIIKREFGNSRKIIEVNLKELISDVSHHQLELAPNDVIVIPQEKPLLGKDSLAVMTILTFLLSSVVAVSLIDRNNRN